MVLRYLAKTILTEGKWFRVISLKPHELARTTLAVAYPLLAVKPTKDFPVKRLIGSTFTTSNCS
jgi:hypothetical protein